MLDASPMENLGNCDRCKRPLIEIDHYGEQLVGCIECNRWGFRGSKRLFMELPEEEREALRRVRSWPRRV
jgi:hypothetical protein